MSKFKGWTARRRGPSTSQWRMLALLAPLATPISYTSAHAAETAPARQEAPNRDVVRLENGETIAGWVTRYVPASYVILKTEAATVTIAAAEISTVSFAERGPETGTDVAARLISENAGPVNPETPAPRAPETPASTKPAPAKAITQRSWLDARAGTLGRSTAGPDGTLTHKADLREGKLSREQHSRDGRVSSKTELDARVASASYESSTNCSDAYDPGCSQQVRLSAGATGIGAELSETHVARVKTPPNGYAVLGLDAGVLGITGELVNGIAAQASAGIRGAIGGRLPGAAGGGWSGLGLDLQLGIAAGQVEVDVYDPYYGSEPLQVDYQLGSLSTAVGWQYLHFRTLDPVTLAQGGFGLFLGYRAGINKDLINDEAEVTVSHGPQLGISFPRYNAGTASVSDFTIKGMILPTGDMTLFALSLGFGF